MSDTGSTPLLKACVQNYFNTVKFLVANGANVLQTDFEGQTCLMASVNSVSLCEYLLKSGTTANALDINQCPALHYAIKKGQLGTAKLLLEYNADPYLKDCKGNDALQHACLLGIFSGIFSISIWY